MPKYLSIGLSIAVVLSFLIVLFQNALNAPSFDDYDTTLNFIKRIFFENHPGESILSSLLSRHNEHRILLSKTVAATYYSLFGELQFRHLVFFQNLLLFGFFGLLLLVLRQQKLLKPELVLFSCLMLFSLSFWQVTFYYWGGIQYYAVFFFCFLSLYLLNKSESIATTNFLGSIVAATLAALSFGNGFLAVLLGAFVLFARKKWQMLAVWGVFAAAILTYALLIDSPVKAGLRTAFNVEWMFRLLFTFLGSFVYINPPVAHHANIIVCMFVGFGVLTVWLFLFWNGYAFRQPLLYSLLSLPVLTAIMVAISRFESKAGGGIAPRYMFFTATIPVFLLLILIDLKWVRLSQVKYLVIVAACIWGAGFYNNRNELIKLNREIAVTLDRWRKDKNTRLIYYREAAHYSETMSWALSQKVVRMPGSGTVFTNATK